jgi:hypothetical protein
MSNNFLVSVANAIIRDPNTGAGLAYCLANIDSAMTMTTKSTEVRGGIGNQLLFVYISDRKVDFKITQATFDENILAMNAGNFATNAAITAVKTDKLLLSASGSATLSASPLGAVQVFLPNNTVQTVTPAGLNITVSGGNSQVANCIYDYTVTADQLPINAQTPPLVVDLTLQAEERDNTNTVVYYVQIHVPRFQVTGNYTLTLNANGVSNQVLEGSALVTTSTDTNPDYYAKVTYVPASSVSPYVYGLAASPTTLSFSVAAGFPQSKGVTLYGLRGGFGGNIVLTTSASFAVTSGCSAAGLFSVGAHTGVVTAGSSIVAGYSAVITGSYVDPTSGALVDNITVVATA